MGRRLYVGNLPYTVEEQELRELFEKHGTVRSVSVIRDRETRRSRGFGFVEFEDLPPAGKARETMEGYELHGRPLRVNEAVDPRDRSA